MHSKLTIIALLLTVPSVRARAQEPITAFVDVAVIPMDINRVVPHQTVVVRGGQILDIGPVGKIKIPATATRVDGRKRYLMPGLADMHAHLPGLTRMLAELDSLHGDRLRMMTERSYTPEDLQEAEDIMLLYVATGVTTIRVMHGSPEILDLRDRIAKGMLLGPSMFVGTPMIPAKDVIDLGPVTAGLTTPQEAVRVAEIAKERGYDFIKPYGIAGAMLDSLFAASQRAGLPLAGHAPDVAGLEIEEAIRVGYKSIEHLMGFGPFMSNDTVADTAVLHAMAGKLRSANVWSCPTLMVLGYNLGYFMADSFARWPEARYIRAGRRSQWKAGEQTAEATEQAARGMVANRKIVKALHDAGAELLLGADASGWGIVPGFSIARELQELVKAGLTPYEALLTGTRNVAEYFGTLESAGTIARGKRADLVLLAGNPLDDISHIARPMGVMVHGRWLTRAELDARLIALEGKLF